MTEPFVERRAPPPPPPFTWSDMDKHIDEKLKPIHAKLDELKSMMVSAVPDGDFDGHRKAHEAWLAEVKERREMWAKVRSSLLEKSLWTLAVGLAGLLLYWIQGHIRP